MTCFRQGLVLPNEEEDDSTCRVCKEKTQNMEHVLSCWRVALANGRYTWRNNRVLEELTTTINNHMNPEAANMSHKLFCRWTKNENRIKTYNWPLLVHRQNILGIDDDWIVVAYLLSWQSNYPKFIKGMGQRPDIVLL